MRRAAHSQSGNASSAQEGSPDREPIHRDSPPA